MTPQEQELIVNAHQAVQEAYSLLMPLKQLEAETIRGGAPIVGIVGEALGELIDALTDLEMAIEGGPSPLTHPADGPPVTK